jgi:hypothetical protein
MTCRAPANEAGESVVQFVRLSCHLGQWKAQNCAYAEVAESLEPHPLSKSEIWALAHCMGVPGR